MDKQVLLVDDDIDDHEIFCMALENLENCYKCIFAKDGIEALEILKNEEIFIPDIIFLDLNMPRMNGIDCLYEIKKIIVPAIFLSSCILLPLIRKLLKELKIWVLRNIL